MIKKDYINNICIGCGLCHSVLNVQFNTDKKGFPVPLIEDVNQHELENLCPLNRYEQDDVKFNLWGVYQSVYAGYSNNPEIRHKASSGGVLTEMAVYMLENGIVDGIIHTCVSPDSPVGTQTVISKTKEEVINRCGSRYSISSPLMNIKQIVEDGKKYAFIGKPCDVSALKRYMEMDCDLKKRIVVTMSFFCAGTPSIDANRVLLEKMGCKYEECKEIQYRGDGWPGYTTAIDTQGKEYRIEYNIAWGQYLGRDVRKICRQCFDGIGEFADIVCADLWYLNENNWPDFGEHEGRNVIFCRTEFADTLIQKAVQNEKITVLDYKVEMEKFYLVQPYQFERRTTMKCRLTTLRLFGRFVPKYNIKMMKQGEQYALTGAKFRIFRGTVKRILQGKL